MANAEDQAQFVGDLAPFAQQVANATGNSQREILGLWALESGWGTGNIHTNNPGSIMEPGTQKLATYGSLGEFATAEEKALEQDGMTGYASNESGFAQAASAYDPTNPGYSQSVLSTINSVPNQANGVSVCLSGACTGPSVLKSGTATTPDLTGSELSTGATGTTSTNGSGSGSQCEFSLLDLPSWLQCEGFNLLFIGIGCVILIAVIARQLGFGMSDIMPDIPPIIPV